MKYCFLIITFCCFFFISWNANSQCTWVTVEFDDFEYTTPMPWLIPATTYHPAPSNWAAYNGASGLYMNFVNGLPSNTLVYDRIFEVCPGTEYELTQWMCTRFSGVQCDVTMNILDENGVPLTTYSGLAPYFPNWINWGSGTFVPTTDTIRFQVFTNIPGSPGGNDLAIDDIELKKCDPTSNFTITTCTAGISINLYDSLASPKGVNGIWSGPSTLSNGYLGTYTAGINTPGLYIYSIDNPDPLCSDSLGNVTVTVVTPPFLFPQPDYNVCDSFVLPGILGINLSGNQAFYTGSMKTGTQYSTGQTIYNSMTLYVYDEVVSQLACFDEDTFQITISLTPLIDPKGNLTGCDSVILPPITGTNLSGNQGYYTAPLGGGTKYLPGQAFYNTQQLFMYDQSPANINCFDETWLFVIVKDSPNLDPVNDTTVCNLYTFPVISGTDLSGNEGYYSGPNGTGTAYPVGQTISVSQKIYIYDVSSLNPVCEDQDSFNVTILPSPDLDPISDTTVCDTFVLPAITGTDLSGNEAYFSGPNGTGTKYLPGAVITASTVLYAYDFATGTVVCDDEEQFLVNVRQSPELNPAPDTVACSQFILPAIQGNNLSGNQAYYSGPLGTGTTYPVGHIITTAQWVHIYDFTSVQPYCYDVDSFYVQLSSAPSIDPIADTTVCDTFILLPITGADLSGNAAYFNAPDGGGLKYLPGQAITSTTVLYAYDSIPGNTGCVDEYSFLVTVLPAPNLFPVNDTSVCDTFFLLPYQGNNLTGAVSYYTGPSGTGTSYSPGQPIPSTIQLYIYDPSATGMCPDEVNFIITVQPAPQLDPLNDTTECDQYILPAITGTNVSPGASYYSGPGGTGASYQPGQSIVSTGTYYVYDLVGGNPPCFDEQSFIVTILPTPDLDVVNDTAVCDSMILLPVQGSQLSGNQAYYTGMGGTGTVYQPSQVIKNTIQLYIYDQSPNFSQCFDEVPFRVTVQPPPVLDPISDTSHCGPYTLPVISGINLTGSQAYYSGPGGTGTSWIAGQSITLSGLVYVYDVAGGNPPCDDETSFLVTILFSPILDPVNNITVCDSFILQPITGTNLSGGQAYYTGPSATGTQMQPGQVIYSTQLVYIFDSLNTSPFCSHEISFLVTVMPPPVLDPVVNTTACDSFLLPVISGSNLTANAAYYSGPGGTGIQYSTGQYLYLAGTYYIYDMNGNCTDETSFLLTLSVSPEIDPVQNLSGCDSVVLPNITGNNLSGNQAFFAGTGGTGQSWLPGDAIYNSMQLFVFDQATGTNCTHEVVFQITVTSSPDLTPVADIVACDQLILPPISGTNLTGNEAYYSGTLGTGTKWTPGQALTSGQTVYIYDAVNPNCFDEVQFVLTVDFSPGVMNIGNDTLICTGDSIVLTAYADFATSYLWDSGETGPIKIANEERIYRVTAINACGSTSDSLTLTLDNCGICSVYIPNAFTPNGDGKNDRINLTVTCEDLELELKIFNRWGEMIYSEKGLDPSWDGEVLGHKSIMGVYIYLIHYIDLDGSVQYLSGNITLLR